MSYLLEFDLEEDLGGPGCVLCTAGRRAAWDATAQLLASEVTDGGVRQLLAKVGGLCRDHVHLAHEVAIDHPDPMGLAILAGYLLDDAAKRVSAVRPRARRRWRRHGPELEAVDCPICDAERRRCRAYLEIIAESDDLTALVGAGEGLCLPHLALAHHALEDGALLATLDRSSWRRAAVLHEQLRAFLATFSHGAGRAGIRRRRQRVCPRRRLARRRTPAQYLPWLKRRSDNAARGHRQAVVDLLRGGRPLPAPLLGRRHRRARA